MKRHKKIQHDQVIQVGQRGIFTRKYTLNLPETMEEEIEESESEAYDAIIEEPLDSKFHRILAMYTDMDIDQNLCFDEETEAHDP
jgi:hypothetical protein